MDFRTATDRLAAAGVPLSACAEELGTSAHNLSRMRRAGGPDPHRNALRPPREWPMDLVGLAHEWADRRRQEAGELLSLAAELEAEYGIRYIPPSAMPGGGMTR